MSEPISDESLVNILIAITRDVHQPEGWYHTVELDPARRTDIEEKLRAYRKQGERDRTFCDNEQELWDTDTETQYFIVAAGMLLEKGAVTLAEVREAAQGRAGECYSDEQMHFAMKHLHHYGSRRES